MERSSLEKKVCYASYIDRVKAIITDLFMIYTPVLYFVAYFVVGEREQFLSLWWAPFLVVLLYGLIYSFFLAKFAQTPGKKAYSIRVVDSSSYKKIGFLRAFFRFWVFLLSATVVFGLFIPFFKKDKKALHDILSFTVVIRDISV